MFFVVSLDIVFNSFCLVCSLKIGDNLYDRFFHGCNNCCCKTDTSKDGMKGKSEIQMDLGSV